MTEQPTTQLPLLDESEPAQAPTWRLDESTREVGRRGVRQAREALRAALRARDTASSSEHDRHHRTAA